MQTNIKTELKSFIKKRTKTKIFPLIKISLSNCKQFYII